MELHNLILGIIVGFIVGAWTMRKRAEAEINTLKNLSDTDDLTGLPNSRAFKKRVEEEFLRHKRNNTPLSAILIDVDNFKQINDQFGYKKGDQFIQILANWLRSSLRETDLLFRYKQGDEFALLIPGSDSFQAQGVVKRITNEFKHFIPNDLLELNLGLTMVVSEILSHDEETKDLITRLELLINQKKNYEYKA